MHINRQLVQGQEVPRRATFTDQLRHDLLTTIVRLELLKEQVQRLADDPHNPATTVMGTRTLEVQTVETEDVVHRHPHRRIVDRLSLHSRHRGSG